jgi:hypothetical protein
MRSTRALLIALALIVALASGGCSGYEGSSRPQVSGALSRQAATIKVNYEVAEDTPHRGRPASPARSDDPDPLC